MKDVKSNKISHFHNEHFYHGEDDDQHEVSKGRIQGRRLVDLPGQAKSTMTNSLLEILPRVHSFPQFQLGLNMVRQSKPEFI